MSSPDTQSQKAVSEILSSIRQIISEDVKEDQKDFLPDIKTSRDSEILDLTRMVKEDGSVIQLSPQTNTNESNSSLESLSSLPENGTFSEAVSSPLRSLSETPFMSNNIQNAPTAAMSNTLIETSETPTMASSPDVDSKNTFSNSFEPFEVKTSSSMENLISQTALQESAAAFAELTRATQSFSTQTGQTGVPPTIETAGNYTVDSLMRELMRPLLKDWLDAHLPSLVRTLVVEQIEKVLQQRNIPPAS